MRLDAECNEVTIQVVQEVYPDLVFSHKDVPPNKTVLAGEDNPPELLMVTRTVTGVEELPVTLLKTRTVGGRWT